MIAEQLDRVRDGVEQGYEDLFVETAAPWVLPYLGDLVGYRTLPGYERVLTTGLHEGGRAALAEAVAPRADVAATVANRRRKGTLHLLEEISEQVAGWPARAVELSHLVAHNQSVKLYRDSDRGRTLDLRDGSALALTGTPFDTGARTVDIRRANSARKQGGWTPAGVALFVWRLKSYALTSSPAYCIDRARNLYTFSILGNDSPLVTKPVPEPSPTHIATVDNVPAFITRRLLHDRLLDYYGPGKSFVIRRDGEDKPVPPSDIVVTDLSDWRYRPRRGQVAVDPELGRIAFGARSAPRQGVWVDYHYAYGADMGGGEYERPDRVDRPDAAFYRVGPRQPYRQIMDAYRAWQHDRRADRTGPDGIIEITHSGAYQEQLDFDLDPGDRLELRAAEGARPVIRLLDWYSNRPDALNIRAVNDDCAPHERPRIVLDGLLVAGRGINVTGPMGAVVLRHSTLVPGWSLEPECEPHSPDEPSIVLDRTTACLQIEHSVLGTIEVIGDEVSEDPSTSTSATASWTPQDTTARRCPPRTAATPTPCCTCTARPSSAKSTPMQWRSPRTRSSRASCTWPGAASAACATRTSPPAPARHEGTAASPISHWAYGRCSPPCATGRPGTGSWPIAARRGSGAARTTVPRWAPSTTSTGRSARTVCARGSPSTRPRAPTPGSSS